MFEILDRFLGFLLPEDDSPFARRRWRATVAIFCCIFIIHIAWACGFIPGLPGFAFANEVLQAKTNLEERITGLENTVEQVDRKVDTILLLSLQSRIRALATERCNSKSSETRRRISNEIDVLQSQHQEIGSDSYAIPGCDQL